MNNSIDCNYLDNNHRVYYVKNIRHEIPESISFRKNENENKFHYNNKQKQKIDKLYDHIKFTVDILDKYIPNKYCCDSGTLLGCIRHQGIIPWDSDADFVLMKPEIKILIKNLKEINKEAKKKNYEFIYIPLYGSFKIYYKGHCYVDLFGFDFMNSDKKTIAMFSPEINGKNTFFGSKIFANLKYNMDDIFPIQKKKFEDFELNCPNNYKKVIKLLYSPNVLNEIVLPSNVHEWAHDDFFNKKKAIWLYDIFYKYFEKYPFIIKYELQFIPLLISYYGLKDYLSFEQKMQYFDIIGELDIKNEYSYLAKDIIQFHINNEPLKLLDNMIKNI